MLALKENAPGAQYDPGVVPEEWMEWAKHNVCAGVPSTKVMRKLKVSEWVSRGGARGRERRGGEGGREGGSEG